MAWYKESFGALYPLIYRHRGLAQAEPEADFAVEALGLRRGDRVLDLASGDGRHLQALLRRGLLAFGADLSEPLLEIARGRRLPVVRADMRALPFGQRFTAVLSFFTSFGYFDTDQENLGVLGQVARCLLPGGRLLLDLPNRGLLEKTLVPRSEKVADGFRIIEERSIEGDRMVKRILIDGDGKERNFLESVRLYAPEEIREGLRAAGLRPDRFYGGFQGDDFAVSSGRMIVTAVAGGDG